MDNKIKIIEIVEPGGWGGVPKHVFELLNNIDLSRFDITLLYSSGRGDIDLPDRLAGVNSRGISTQNISMTRSIHPVLDFWAFISIYKRIRSLKPDIVHSHSSKAGVLGRLGAKLVSKDIQTVYTPHGMAYKINRFYGFIEKFCSRFTNIMIATSDSERDEIINQHIIHREQVKVIYNGINCELAKDSLTTEEKSYIRNKLGMVDQDIFILSGGRLDPMKDPLTFFSAAKLLIQQVPNLFFIWLGDGKQKNEIINFINQNGLEDRTVITGWLSSIDSMRYIETMDIFVSSSLSESFGYMACEAMAKGKPVIATRTSGSIDLITEGYNGLLIPPKSATDLSEAIMKLVNSPETRDRMGREGQKIFLNRFTLDRMVKETESLYSSLAFQSMR